MPTVTRLHSDQGASVPQSGTHEGEWRVELDAPGSAGDALNATGAPRVGQYLSGLAGGLGSESGLVCIEADPRRDGDSLTAYIIRARFTNRPFSRPIAASGSPLFEGPQWSFHMTTRRVAYRDDWYGNLYQSAALRPFRPREVDEPGLMLLHEQNETGSNLGSEWFRSVNNSIWLGYGIHCVLLWDINFRPVYSQLGVQYYRVRREFQIRFPMMKNIVSGSGASATAVNTSIGGWDTALLNEDFYDINGVRFIDSAGANCVEPRLLTPTGLELPQGGTPSYMRYYDYQEANFSALNIMLS